MGRPEKKGIVDPWRIDEPFHKPAPPPSMGMERKKINLSDIDWDADLRVAESYIFQSRHGSIKVQNKTITSGNDALRDLVCCLFQVLETMDGPDLLENAKIGIKLHTREWQEPVADLPVARMRSTEAYTPEATIWFLQQTFDEGMLRLIRLLNSVRKRSGKAGVEILNKWGVTPQSR